jgi:anionic cell wall polymer biosynthesis LytR-Cps2A-Psr (LCP) family protein
MRSISFRTILIAAAVGFFVLGLATTILRPRTPSERAVPTSTRRPRSTEPVQRTPRVTILILGVDSLEADEPELLAVWLASFRPAGKELFLFGFPTNHELPDGTPLQDAFAAGGDPLESLNSLTVLPVDAAIVLDSEGFAELIDFLGGVPTGETNVDGEAALSVLALPRTIRRLPCSPRPGCWRR